jgi:hypothetical protein
LANAIAVDPTSGEAYVVGETTSTDLPTSAGAVQSANAGGYDGFIARLNTDGTAFLYATYLGGNRNDFLQGLAVDPNGNAYVTGYTNSNTFPTNVPIQSAIQGNSTSLFATSNTGATWMSFDANLPGGVRAISPDPTNAGTIIASTEAGIYRTTDRGGTWTQQFSGGYLNLSRSPANSSTIYGLSGSVYQSSDNGVTWLFKGSPVCCGGDIIADPLNAATAYVFNSFNTLIPGVQKTANNGATWSPATSGLPANPIVTAMAAGSDGSLYVGLAYIPGLSPGGVYKSTDQGATWVPINNGLHANFSVPPQGLAVAASNPSVVYVTDYFSLYKSTNGGTTWSAIGSPVPGGTSALAISNIDSGTLYYAAYYSTAQLWVSNNSGVTWSPAAGLGVAAVNRIVPDPLNGAGAYALASVSIVPIVAKIDAAGQNLLYSTYLGDYGAAYGIATNGTGDAFVTGSTWEFPTTPSALQGNRNVYNNNLDGFVARISDATATCSYSVDPLQSLEVWFTHLVHYVVTAPSGCSWTASSNQPWATIASGASGSGSGIVYVLANNMAATTETATLTIAGQSITLRQRTVAGCGYNFFDPDSSVVPGGGGTVQFSVIVGAGCEWTVTNNDPTAITIVSGASGTGNGTVTLNVAPNLGPNTRTFSVQSPQGGTETISQAGTTAPAVVATITSFPSGASIAVTGNGCIPGTYTTPTNLTWNANTNCAINFISPQFIGGSQYAFGSATVNGGTNTGANPLTVNSGSSAMTINAIFTAPCVYSLSPSGQGFGAQGGLSSFTVNSTPDCSWGAVPSAGWITILPSGSKGTGKVNYAVATNSGGPRTGTISVGGQNYNIDQQALTCTFSIAPSVAAFDNSGGSFRVVVTAPAGCTWTANSNVGWLSVTSGASGSGNGAVVLQAAANSGGSRSGTVTIAGQTFSATQGAGACGALDVTSQMGVFQGGLGWVPPNLYPQRITVRNNSGSVIRGPVFLVLIGEPTWYGFPFDSFLLGGGSTTSCFSSPGDYLVLVSGDMQAGQTVEIPLVWITQTFGSVRYSIKVLSGTPTH